MNPLDKMFHLIGGFPRVPTNVAAGVVLIHVGRTAVMVQ